MRLPHSCVYHPYIQTTIAQARRSIETIGQRRSTAIIYSHTPHTLTRLTSQICVTPHSFLTLSEATSLMCISPIYSNSHSSGQTVDRNNRTTPFDSYHIPSQALTSQICVTPHSFFTLSEATSLMCISPIYSNSHSSGQTVDRNNRTTPFDSYHIPSEAPHLKSASHLTVFSH